MLDLILTYKLKGSFGCSDHEMMEFRVLRAVWRVHSKLTTLDFIRANFGLFGICLVEYHGIKLWREGGLKKVG